MGHFIDTSYNDAMDFITDSGKELLKNPLYVYNDKKALKVTYYHIDIDKSTLDEAARIPYSDLGPNCPFRFNLIHNMMIYGADKIQLSIDNGEAGLESGEISGDAYILPNTIKPYPGDYFYIDHIDDSKWLFRVISVMKDTLNDGANGYQIQYKLEHTNNENIIPLIVDEYNTIINNVGNDTLTPIIKTTEYNLIEKLDILCIKLKRYYKEIFYDNKVQTFIYLYTYDSHIYDDYMIEFLIRNNVLSVSGQKDYIVVEHKLVLPNTFSINYEKTFLYSLESKDINNLYNATRVFIADKIDNMMSIFNRRPENYFDVSYYRDDHLPLYYAHKPIEAISEDVIDHIVYNKLYDLDDPNAAYNIIIKYFNNIDYTIEDISIINNIDYNDNVSIFYLIPMIIYCLESDIKRIMSKTY